MSKVPLVILVILNYQKLRFYVGVRRIFLLIGLERAVLVVTLERVNIFAIYLDDAGIKCFVLINRPERRHYRTRSPPHSLPVCVFHPSPRTPS